MTERRKQVQEKIIYAISAAIAVPIICMMLSVLLPESQPEAAMPEILKPKEARFESVEPETSAYVQDRPTGEPSGFPDELSAMPCCNVPNALELLDQEKPTINQEINQEPGEAIDEQETVEEASLPGAGAEQSAEEGHEEGCKADFQYEETLAGTVADPEETDAAAAEEPAADAFRLYRVNGALLSPELQRYAYDTLESFGIGWYYPTFLCQMYQESRFLQSAVSSKGDYGICQIKGEYHEAVKAAAGIPWADLKADPWANIYAGAFLMAGFIQEAGDLNTAISAYNTGFVTVYNQDYVDQVLQWVPTLEVE